MSTNTTTQKSSNQKAQALKLERVFNATPEKLWSFWTDPKKYAKWFNPAPIDLVIHEFDPKPGGKIRFDMPQPDGSKNPQEGVFHSLTPYSEIVSGAPDKSFLLTVNFVPMAKGMTRLVVNVTGVPPEYHAMATTGWNQGFDHLERELGSGPAIAHAKGGSAAKAANTGFTIERILKAPPEKVWAMWTTKDGMAKWWGPAAKEMGFDLKVLKLDVRVGGEYAVEMRNSEMTLVNHGKYTQVQPNRRLAQVWEFDIFLAPGESAYDVPISIDLEPVAGGTKLTFKQGPLATAEHSEGSRQGVLNNIAKLEKALGQ